MSKPLILNAALKLAAKTRYDRVTREAVAAAADVAAGSVNYYFGDMANLRKEMIQEAIKLENWTVVAHALMDKHPATADLSASQRAAAMAAAFS